MRAEEDKQPQRLRNAQFAPIEPDSTDFGATLVDASRCATQIVVYDLQDGAWEQREERRTLVNISGTKMEGNFPLERFGQAIAVDTQLFLFGRKERSDGGKIKLRSDLYALDLTTLKGDY